MIAMRGRSEDGIDVKPLPMVLTVDHRSPYHAFGRANQTISKQLVRLSTERHGRETLSATVRHDGVEDAARAGLDLAAGIVLIQPVIPRLDDATSGGMPEFQDFFHAAQCAATVSRKHRTLVPKNP
jgi:hypothetical protein